MMVVKCLKVRSNNSVLNLQTQSQVLMMISTQIRANKNIVKVAIKKEKNKDLKKKNQMRMRKSRKKA